MDEVKLSRANSRGDEIWVTEFTQESAQQFREQLLEEVKGNPIKPVIVYIDSYGGRVDALAKMIATMDEIPNPIITAVMGCAMSCGAILLSHGDMRFCDPHARVMVHRVSSGTYGDVEDMTNSVSETERMNKYWLGFMAVNANMKGGYDQLNAFIKSKDGTDRYLTAEETLELGIIDAIGRPKIAQATIYEVVSGPDKMPIHKRAKLRKQYKEEDKISKSTKKKKTTKKVRKK